MGVPVIASDIPPHREFLNGAVRLVPPDDDEALAHELASLLGAPPVPTVPALLADLTIEACARRFLPGLERLLRGAPVTFGPDLLLTFDFPPMGGGIARWMAELALGYPSGSLIVSTGSLAGGAESDARFPNRSTGSPSPSARLRTLWGLIVWSRRVRALAREHSVPFLWCGNIRPAAYPAAWVRDRTGIPYGVMVYGGDLLLLRNNYRKSRFKRRAARRLLGFRRSPGGHQPVHPRSGLRGSPRARAAGAHRSGAGGSAGYRPGRSSGPDSTRRR
jgi:glycosyltransferase involved in cell wall biosynthesis